MTFEEIIEGYTQVWARNNKRRSQAQVSLYQWT